MSAAVAQNSVYVKGDHSEPMSHHVDLSSRFDLEDPHSAAAQYARIMHEHTKAQLGMASNSARRRSQPSAVPSLQNDTSSTSSRASVDSTSS